MFGLAIDKLTFLRNVIRNIVVCMRWEPHLACDRAPRLKKQKNEKKLVAVRGVAEGPLLSLRPVSLLFPSLRACSQAKPHQNTCQHYCHLNFPLQGNMTPY